MSKQRHVFECLYLQFSVTQNLQTTPISSVQFSHSVVSDSLQLPGLQHARSSCPSPPPGVYSDSCPLSWWCHSTISCSVTPFSSRLQSFPAPGSFQMSYKASSSSHQVARVLEFQLQYQSFRWIFRTDLSLKKCSDKKPFSGC